MALRRWRWAGRIAIFVASLVVLSTGASANTSEWYTTSGYYHGHGGYGFYNNQTEGVTQKNGDSNWKTVQVTRLSTGAIGCTHTGYAGRVSCIANIVTSDARSWHSAFGLTGHNH